MITVSMVSSRLGVNLQYKICVWKAGSRIPGDVSIGWRIVPQSRRDINISATSRFSLYFDLDLLVSDVVGNGGTVLPGFAHFLLLIIRTSTVVEIANVRAVKYRLPLARIDLVVRETRPCGRTRPRFRLWWIFLQNLLEVLGTLTARVEAGEQEDVVPEGVAFVLRGLVREVSHGGVQDFPRCPAELGLESFVA